MARPLNILYLHSHDTGRLIQPYGAPVATPNLQKFAQSGVLFRQAFSVSPTCSPSRAGLLTGTYPHQNGMLGLAHRGFSLHDYRWHILHTLREHGYRSALSGIQHIDDFGDTYGSRIGYDEVLYPRPDEVEACFASAFDGADERAVEFLQRDHHEPFFLSVGFFETHRGFPPAEIPADYVGVPAPLPETPAIRQDVARFYTSAQHLDRRIGRVLDALDAQGLSERTLVIITTDHGPPYPEMKCNLTDGGMGVMLMMRGPDGWNGGKVIDAPVTQLDIFPTICDLLKIPAPERLQGQSLAPLVNGQTDTLHEAIFGEINVHGSLQPMRGVRTARWKFIQRFDDYGRVQLPNCDGSAARQHWIEYGWPEQETPREALYDLVFDPLERHNLANDPAHQATKDTLKAQLKAWMERTGDPLLRGSLPLPKGAQLAYPERRGYAEGHYTIA